MKNVLILMVVMLLMGCVKRMENVKIQDCGKLKVGEGVYIKKLYMGDGMFGHGDRVYLLVDENDKLISCNAISTDITVSSGKSSHVETMTFISK